MSASTVTTPVLSTGVIENTKPIREKKAVLSGKFSKFQVFGFWFLENLKHQDLITDVNTAYTTLSLFADVPQQTLFFEQFFEEYKQTNKSMKLSIKNHNKPVKAKKEKKNVSQEGEGEKKRGRKRKEVLIVNDKQEQLIEDLVAAANGLPTASTNNDVPPVIGDKPKRKYVRKSKTGNDSESDSETKTETETEAEAETKTEKEPKTKTETKKEPKTKKETETKKETDTKTVTETDEELEIDVQPIHIDGKDFLVDADNNLYHTDTFEHIGTLLNHAFVPL